MFMAGAASVARLRRRCRPEEGDLTSPLGLVLPGTPVATAAATASSSSESAAGSRPCLFAGRQMLRAISKMACSCGERKEKVAGVAQARDAVAVLALEAAELLDELALGEVELEAAAHVLVERVGVVLVRRERRAAGGRELREAAEDHDLVLLGPESLEQGAPLAAVAGGDRPAAAAASRDGVGMGEVAVFGVATAVRVREGDAAAGGRRVAAGRGHWIRGWS
jgi:hypothetical protein